jgi:hypothetical protein
MASIQFTSGTLAAFPKAPAADTAELLTDPGFDDPSAWTTDQPQYWVVANSQATNSGGDGRLYQPVQLVAGTTYNVLIQANGIDGGGLGFIFLNTENGSGQGYKKLASGTTSFQFTATETVTRAFAIMANYGSGNISACSLKLASG